MDVNGHVKRTTYYVVYSWKSDAGHGVGATSVMLDDRNIDSFQTVIDMAYSIETTYPDRGSVIIINWKELNFEWVRP